MSKKTNVLALTTDTTVIQGIEYIKQQLAELKSIETTSWKTPGKIKIGDGSLKDLKEETNQSELVKAFSTIKLRLKSLDEAYDDLGISPAPVSKIDGGTYEEWLHDFKLRLQVLNQKETYEELKAMEKEWSELMDKEDRKALLIQKMQKRIQKG